MSTASDAILIGNALVTELNAQNATWIRQFEAQRGWLPVLNLEDLVDLAVTVVVPDRSGERLTRGLMRYSYDAFINVQQKVNLDSLTDLDALVQLVDGDMTAWFQDWHYLSGLDLTQAKNKQWSINGLRFDGEVIYDVARLYAEQVFDSTLVLTIKGNLP